MLNRLSCWHILTVYLRLLLMFRMTKGCLKMERKLINLHRAFRLQLVSQVMAYILVAVGALQISLAVAKTFWVSGSSASRQNLVSRVFLYPSDSGKANRILKTVQHPIGKPHCYTFCAHVSDCKFLLVPRLASLPCHSPHRPPSYPSKHPRWTHKSGCSRTSIRSALQRSLHLQHHLSHPRLLQPCYRQRILPTPTLYPARTQHPTPTPRRRRHHSPLLNRRMYCPNPSFFRMTRLTRQDQKSDLWAKLS